MRLCDATIGWIEDRVEATSLVPNGNRPDIDPEVLAQWMEAEAYTASLVDPTVWVDADLVTCDVADVAA